MFRCGLLWLVCSVLVWGDPARAWWRAHSDALVAGGALRDGHAKIADFGVAHHFKDEALKEVRPHLSRSHSRGQLTRTEGTYYFWAPEMCRQGPFSGYSADLWACGVCLYAMIFGVLPFVSEDPLDLFDKIATEPFTLPCSVSPDCKDFLTGLLHKDPDQRLTLAEALTHRFLTRAQRSPSLRSLLKVQVSQDEIDTALGNADDYNFSSDAGINVRGSDKRKSPRSDTFATAASGPRDEEGRSPDGSRAKEVEVEVGSRTRFRSCLVM